MPQQELFFYQATADGRVEVLKIYDQSYAREVFDDMDEEAQAHLWQSLKPEDSYDPADLPQAGDFDGRQAFLWDELVERAREDWNSHSYFVVTEKAGNRTQNLYVSPDWPSAEAFAKGRLPVAH